MSAMILYSYAGLFSEKQAFARPLFLKKLGIQQGYGTDWDSIRLVLTSGDLKHATDATDVYILRGHLILLNESNTELE